MRWLVLGFVALGLVACKQGLGERCQIDSDCQDGLICSHAGPFPTCRTPSADLPDASVVDGPVVVPDGPLAPSIDAAKPDAKPPTFDAQPADATTFDQVKLVELVALWQRTRDPRVAAVIDLVAPPLADGVAPLTPGRKKAEHEDWLAAANALAKGPEDLPRVIPGVTSSASTQATDRMAALPDDPRVAAHLVGILAKPPYTAETTKAFWRALGDRLVALGDTRQIEPLADLESRYLSVITTNMGVTVRVVIKKAVAALRAAVARPAKIKPADAAAIAALAKEHAGALQSGAIASTKQAGARRSAAELLADVYADPAADGPRLVYADFLTEAGDPRGEFIAMQVRRDPATRPRERELFDEHGDKWSKVLAAAVNSSQFERGFPARTSYASAKLGFTKMIGNPAWSTVVDVSFGGIDSYKRDLHKKLLAFLAHPTTRGLRAVRYIWAELLLEADRDFESVGICEEPEDASPLLDRLARMPLRSLGIHRNIDAGWLLEAFADRLEKLIVYDTYDVKKIIKRVEKTKIPRLEFYNTGAGVTLTRGPAGRLSVARVHPGDHFGYVDTRLIPAVLGALDGADVAFEIPYERQTPVIDGEAEEYRKQIKA